MRRRRLDLDLALSTPCYGDEDIEIRGRADLQRVAQYTIARSMLSRARNRAGTLVLAQGQLIVVINLHLCGGTWS
jgi:hypothetical protein